MTVSTAVSSTTTAFRPLDSTTYLRPARLHCPACRRNGVEHALSGAPAGRVEFHQCANCGGLWFYEKNMDEALRATGAKTWLMPAEVPAQAALKPVALAPWNCPCCKGILVDVKDRHGSGATVRRCLVCYGGWMEHDDVLKASDAACGILSKIGATLRSIWNGKYTDAPR